MSFISQSHQFSHHHLNLVTLTLLPTLLSTPLLTPPLLLLQLWLMWRWLVHGLQDLERDFSNIFTDARKDPAKCDVTEMRFFLADLFENNKFTECQTIDEVLRKIRRGHVDTFKVYYLECLISQFHRSDDIMKSIEEYIKKKEQFLKTTTVQEFQQAVVSRAESVYPKGMAEVTIKILNISESNRRTMKDIEKLTKRAFKGLHKDLVRINVTPCSVHHYHLVCA